MKYKHNTIELWKDAIPKDKEKLTSQMFALFPEVLGRKSSSKYHRASLWLANEKGIINPSFRDIFSSNGRKEIIINNKTFPIPAVLKKIEENTEGIINYLKKNDNIKEIRSVWNNEDLELKQTLRFWKKLVIRQIQHHFNNESITAEEFIDSIIT